MGAAVFRYSAFLSYSHAVQGDLAPAVQAALQRFAKPWYRLRALHVFRDKTSLSLTPELWPSIARALKESQYFVLLASPEAAASEWVRKEIDYWLGNRGSDSILIVLTKGELAWDPHAGDFDWNATTALPETLRRTFAQEPLWLDLRWVTSPEQLSLQNATFRNEIASLAAALHGKPKDEMVGEDVRQHRRTRFLAWSTVVSLIVLTLLSIAGAFIAFEQKQIALKEREIAVEQRGVAQEQRAVAVSRQLAANALDEVDLRPDLGLLLAVTGSLMKDTPQSRFSLLATLQRFPYVKKWLGFHRSAVRAVAFSDDGKALATGGCGEHRTEVRAAVVTVCVRGEILVWNAAEARGDPLRLSTPQLVVGVAFIPGGGLASIDSAGTITLWSLADGKPFGKRMAHPRGGRAVVYRESASQLLSAGDDGSIMMWDVHTQRAVDEPIPVHNGIVWHVAVDNHRGRIATAGDDRTVMLYDGAFWHRLEGHTDRVYTVAFSPRGDVLASGDGNGAICLWDASTGLALSAPIAAHRGPVHTLAFSPDGKLLASGGLDRTISLWNVATRERSGVPLMGHTQGVLAIAFDKAGTSLASGSWDGAVVLWDLEAKRHAVRDDPVEGAVFGVAFSRDGKTVASSWKDGALLWDAKDASVRRRLPHAHASLVNAVAYNPDGTLLASAARGNVMLWNADGKPVSEFRTDSEGEITSLAFSPDGTLVVAAGSTVQRLYEVRTEPAARGNDSLHAVSLSPQLSQKGPPAAAGPGVIWAWNLLDRRRFDLQASSDVTSVAFSPDGKKLISGSRDGKIAVWDAGMIKRREHQDPSILVEPRTVGTLAVHPGGRIVAVAIGKQIALWDLRTRVQVAEPLVGHVSEIYGLKFSPNGRMLASGSADGFVMLWDGETGRRIGTFDVPGYWFSTVDFSPDSRVLVAGTNRGNIWFWDVDVEHWRQRACAIANRELTIGERQYYVGSDEKLSCANVLSRKTDLLR